MGPEAVDTSFFDILILAVIAGFLIFRLRSVLGKRHGEERQRGNPLDYQKRQEGAGTDEPAARDDNVVAMPNRRPPQVPPENTAPPGSLEHGLTQIRIADGSFNDRDFLNGARTAFSMIVDAYAKGDLDTLNSLLGREMYSAFAAAIEDRADQGHTLEKRVEAIDSADILAARMENTTAIVTVQFVSHQVDVTRDADGAVVEGNPDTSEEVVDLWTFMRDLSSNDPTWFLIEAESGE